MRTEVTGEEGDMIDLPHRIERPLLDALRDVCPRPMIETAFACVHDRQIQDIAIEISRRVRFLGIEEDERRKNGKKPRLSHRGHIVGGITAGLTQPWPGKKYHGWFAYPSCNSKPFKGVPKFCSEMRGMRFTEKVGHCFICFQVAVGELEEDHGSGLMHETRHMCEGCRAMARSEKYRPMFLDETASLTALPDGDVRELYTIPRLMEIHGEPWPPCSRPP